MVGAGLELATRTPGRHVTGVSWVGVGQWVQLFHRCARRGSVAMQPTFAVNGRPERDAGPS